MVNIKIIFCQYCYPWKHSFTSFYLQQTKIKFHTTAQTHHIKDFVNMEKIFCQIWKIFGKHQFCNTWKHFHSFTPFYLQQTKIKFNTKAHLQHKQFCQYISNVEIFGILDKHQDISSTLLSLRPWKYYFKPIICNRPRLNSIHQQC